jgi:hypothetical protein
MLKWSISTVNVQQNPVVPRIRGPLKDFSHDVYCCPSYFSGIPELILHFTAGGKKIALHMSSQVEVCRRERAIMEVTQLVHFTLSIDLGSGCLNIT